jgi:carboxylesterase type B
VCAATVASAQQAPQAPTCKACGPVASKYITVATINGPITGHLASNVSCVVEYLGIPFVKPPVGELRFAAPQRFVGSTPYEAKSFGNDYPLTASKPVAYPLFTPLTQRIVSLFASAAGTPQSEDCLTLNVWAKPTPRSERADKPVIVFFYGGREFLSSLVISVPQGTNTTSGFTIGNTNSVFYNGRYFANAQDVIVVTVNYRLNIFGFPGAPGGTQNQGLRDQRAAVE